MTLALHTDDVMRAIGSQFQREGRAKFIEFPSAVYSMHPYDKVTKNGKVVGLSMFAGYSFNERQMLSMGVLDADVEVGDELVLTWGEEDGGTRKTTVERPHKQKEIRVKVGPVPYSRDARESYAQSWRTRSQ